MKKMIFVAFMVLLGTTGLLAQRPGGGTPPSAADRAARTVTALSEKVTITDEQKTELTATFETFYEDMMKNRGDRDKMSGLVTTRDEQVKAILGDDEKYEAYTTLLAENRKRGPRGGGGKRSKKL